MNVEHRIREIVVTQLKVLSPDRVTAAARLFEDLNADSLDKVEIAMAVEEEFQIEVTDAELEELTTFGDVVKLVEQRAA